MTQSAVSHRVRRLERHFGSQLIQRKNPGLALTAAGAALLPELIAVLNKLEGLGGRRERRLRVAAASAVCTWWLAKRLSAFMQQRPGLSIELVPIESDATSVPQVDVRILWVNEGDVTSPTQASLAVEHVFPVCSPGLVPNRRALREAGALAEMMLLHKSHGVGEWSWSAWFDRLVIEQRKGRQGELRFADMGLMLSAAVDGAGVALARSLLACDALRDRRLIVPIAGIEPMISAKKHVARWRRDRADDPDIQAFVTWLVGEAKASVAATEKFIRFPPARPVLLRGLDRERRGLTAPRSARLTERF